MPQENQENQLVVVQRYAHALKRAEGKLRKLRSDGLGLFVADNLKALKQELDTFSAETAKMIQELEKK